MRTLLRPCLILRHPFSHGLRHLWSASTCVREMERWSLLRTAGGRNSGEGNGKYTNFSTNYFSASVVLATLAAVACMDVSNCERNQQIDHNESDGRIPLTRNFVAAAVDRVAPSVVNIMCMVETRLAVGASSGSGFIISDDGFIVTNAHVVAPAASGKVLITMRNGKKRRGYVHSLDGPSDIALIKLENDSSLTSGSGGRSYDSGADILLPVKMGTSANMRGGEFVVALGSPMQLQNSASLGIISATARHASELGLTNNRSEYLQTDAAINVGNSGGPLVNLDGEVIGINTMKVKGTDGISFAIPIDVASQIIKQLKANKKVIRPYVGMKLANFLPDAPDDRSSTLWNPFGRSKRKTGRQQRDEAFYNTKDMQVIVMDVVINSPAYQCGLESGDIITEVDGKKVNGVRDVLDAIGLDVGKTLALGVYRPSTNDQMTLHMTTQPESK